jgi:hypothetical protein
MTVENRLAELSDQQVLAILDALTGELASGDTPEGAEEQANALGVLLEAENQAVDVKAAVQADQAKAAAAARELIGILAEIPEVEGSVGAWLKEPPSQEAAAIPLLLAAPIVLTGCLVLLQVAGHTRFQRTAEGKWTVDYDPARRTPFDKTVRQMVGTLAKLMSSMIPGA